MIGACDDAMNRLVKVALGVMTAIGGFVDIGNLVTSGITGARFGMSLTWAIVVATIGMTAYGEMAGRVTSVTGRPVFDTVRERLGVRTALLNLIAFILLTVLTLAAEIGGVAIVLALATGVNYLVFVPFVGAAVWLVAWRLKFSIMENVLGLLGLALVIFVVALFVLPTPWGQLWDESIRPTVPTGEGHPTYLFYAISLFGACVVPYQVVFFSSGAREEHWTPASLAEMRLNVAIGFPLGGLLSIAIMATSAVALRPAHVDVNSLGQVADPLTQAFGHWGLAIGLVGFFAAMFAAASECALSIGYAVSQLFGWTWGKDRKPRDAPQFHLVTLIGIAAATALILTSIDPIQVTIVAVVLGAAAIPLTYFPVLVVANDRDYMGGRINRGWFNAVSVAFLLLMVATSVATIPLLFLTKAGQ
jgi:Mn2+/Fe2+ NRAMP family transporter